MKSKLKNLKQRVQAAWKIHTKDFVYKKGNRGATFVEIIVTISIILILMTSVGVAIFQWIPKAQETSARQTLASIKMGIDMYYMSEFHYPDNLQEITEYLDPPVVPKDPWGNPFQYSKSPSDDVPYDIFSYGQDGSEGGSGAAADIRLNDSDQEDSE